MLARVLQRRPKANINGGVTVVLNNEVALQFYCAKDKEMDRKKQLQKKEGWISCNAIG